MANSAGTATGGAAYANNPYQNVPYSNHAYGVPYGGPTNPVQAFASKKIAAGICGILIGGLGIHKFVLGFNTAGILMLLTTVIGAVTGACLIVPILAPMAMGVIGLVEGILYLTKSDEEFYQHYAIQRREWF
jgi:TM2 domain-containing membrane protein YozV